MSDITLEESPSSCPNCHAARTHAEMFSFDKNRIEKINYECGTCIDNYHKWDRSEECRRRSKAEYDRVNEERITAAAKTNHYVNLGLARLHRIGLAVAAFGGLSMLIMVNVLRVTTHLGFWAVPCNPGWWKSALMELGAGALTLFGGIFMMRQKAEGGE